MTSSCRGKNIRLKVYRVDKVDAKFELEQISSAGLQGISGSGFSKR